MDLTFNIKKSSKIINYDDSDSMTLIFDPWPLIVDEFTALS